MLLTCSELMCSDNQAGHQSVACLRCRKQEIIDAVRTCLRSSRSSNITIEPVSHADSPGMVPERNGSNDSQLPSRNTSLESNYDEHSSDQAVNGTADSSGHSARSTPLQERRGMACAVGSCTAFVVCLAGHLLVHSRVLFQNSVQELSGSRCTVCSLCALSSGNNRSMSRVSDPCLWRSIKD